jgi:predicted TIM-barrel fold metal-dependent hydrolase
MARGFHDLLLEDMTRAGVSHAVVVAMDPAAGADYVLELCSGDRRLYPVVAIHPNERDVRGAVERARARGAIGVKLHACATGVAPDGAHATALVDAAADAGLIIIIHTGRARVGLYKAPENGDPRAFAGHFDRRPDATFVLAHMNMAEPEFALDVARRRANVHVDTSWQEARDVRRAVAVLGAERVLFASDWPFGGDLMGRARRAVDRSALPSSVRDLILFGNAQKLIAARRVVATASPVGAGARG